MTGELVRCPGGQARIGLLALALEALLELGDLLAELGRVLCGLERRQARFQLEDGCSNSSASRHTRP